MSLGRSRRKHSRLIFLAVVIATPATLVAACGGAGNSPGTGGAAGFGGETTSSTSTKAQGSGGSGNAGGTGNTGGIIHTDGGCSNSNCNGTCVSDGTCCPNADVCGDACCAGATVCLFDQCVTPGTACHTSNDCPTGQYCETGLGSGGGGVDGGLEAGCTEPPPPPGRCLARPPVCPEDGGTPDGGCVADCEYHPPVDPMLHAQQLWHWDDTNALEYSTYADIWATPAIGRVYDSNCDGKVDELDPPNVIFVSGNATDPNNLYNMIPVGNCCQCISGQPAATNACHAGVLRMLDGSTGKEIWSLAHVPALGDGSVSMGFAGLSVAIGDVDGDGKMDILAVTGEGYIAMIDANGNVERVSDKPIPGATNDTFGWGGGLAIADMDGDGFPEIAYGATVFTTTNNAITLKFTGTAGIGGPGNYEALSTFVDLNLNNDLELLAGCAAYKYDGTILWNRCVAPNALPDGFSAVADFNNDGHPEVVLVTGGQVYILDGATGTTKLGPVALAGGGNGGPPTVADFDGDGKPEIGVAQQNYYYVLKPNYGTNAIDILWQVQNHDLSSSVTGSSVFDFEGDGKAEVIYADECFLWVFDGQTGAVRYAAPHTSFTATEASLVADINGDGHAEMLMVSNSADPSNSGWKCMDATGTPVTLNGVTWTPGPYANGAYRGLVLFGDQASSWVGTRTLWNEHTYHVSNICDDRDSACAMNNKYGAIPAHETRNWTLPWLNDFRQNVQDKGIFDAPDATVSLTVKCTTPVAAKASVRNIGLAALPAGVVVGIFRETGGMFTQQVGQTQTTHQLFPGQTEQLSVDLDPTAHTNDTFVARILVDPNNPTFHECRDDNDESDPIKPHCVQ